MPLNNPPAGCQRGAVLVLAAMVIAALITVGAWVIHFGYTSSMRAELQTASDAAAIAAASRLNSSKTGWDDAREAAVLTFNEQTALSGIGSDKSLAVVDDPSTQPTEWDLTSQKNLKIRLERGMWRSGTFTSLEGDYQANNPGVPTFIVANSARVTIERPSTFIFGSALGGNPRYSISVTSTALRGPTDEVCVAPFALPVCSLVDTTGAFMSERICKGDRIFARADRYCRPGDAGYPDCKALPSTPYTPVSPVSPIYSQGGDPGATSLNIPLNQTYNSFPNPAVSYRDLIMKDGSNPPGQMSITTHFNGPSSCGANWGFSRQQNLGAVSDHYGVVGLPGEIPSNQSLEGEILRILSGGAANAQTCVGARIGDSFHILPNGLTSLDAGNNIWNIIDNDGSVTITHPERYVPFVQSLLGSLEHKIENMEWMASPDGLGGYVHRACNVDYRYKGACNSRRGQFTLTAPAVDNGWGLYFSTYSFKLFGNATDPNPGITDQSTVWRVKIPVIAETGPSADTCQGMSPIQGDPPAVRDPLVDPTKSFLIVGFVEVILYDVDIGRPPPDYQIGNADGSAMEPFPEVLRFQEDCNNVRARVNCDSRFIPSSNILGYHAPRLVPQ